MVYSLFNPVRLQLKSWREAMERQRILLEKTDEIMASPEYLKILNTINKKECSNMEREKIIVEYDRATGSVYFQSDYGEQYLGYLDSHNSANRIVPAEDLSEINGKLDAIIRKMGGG